MDIVETDRSEREAVRTLLEAAFPTAEEADLVAALRSSPAYDESLDLVATEDGTVTGHVLFSRLRIPGTTSPESHLVLAPLAVAPGHQGDGIGSALVREGLDRAREQGYESVLLHGSPAYYGRFGFERADRYGLENPFDLPDEDFQALERRSGALDGATGPVSYPGPFEQL